MIGTTVRPGLRQSMEIIAETHSQVTCYNIHSSYQRVCFATGSGNNMVIVIYDYLKKAYISRRSFKDICNASLNKNTIKSIGVPKMSRANIESAFHNLPLYCQPNNAISSQNITQLSSSLHLSTVNHGSLKSIYFSDYTHLQTQWSEKPGPKILYNTFHSECLLMLLCDYSIIFHDFSLNTSRYIGYNELDRSQPICATFIHPHILAIGCNDGNIRLFNWNTWSTISTHFAHSKISKSNEVNAIKSIPEHVSDDSKLNNETDENSFRFLSISRDATSFIWIGTIRNNSVDMTEPVAMLKPTKRDRLFTTTSLPVLQYLDYTKDHLYCISTSNKARVYDLSTLPSTSSLSRPPSVRSFTTLSSIKQSSSKNETSKMNQYKIKNIFKSKPEVSENLILLPCVSIIAPALCSELGKVSTCALLRNPYLYPSDFCFLYTNKSEFLHMAVAHSANKSLLEKSSKNNIFSDAVPSETVSNHSGSSAADLSSGLPFKSLSVVESLNLCNASEEHRDVKAISILVHEAYMDHMIINTNVGLILVRFKNIIPHGTQTIGTHHLWGLTTLSFSSQRRVIYQRSSGGAIAEEDGDDSRSNSESEGFDRGVTESVSAYGCSSEYNCNVTGSAASFVSSLPMFFPSPSGRYCIVHWPHSMAFVVLRLANITSANPSLSEVDRGVCVSIGWIGGSDGVPDDIYAILTPSQRLMHQKKKGMMSFGKKEEDTVTIVPQQFLLFRVEVSSKTPFHASTESLTQGGWEPLVMRGGPLLCITLKKEDSKERIGKTVTRYKSHLFNLSTLVDNKTKKKKLGESQIDDKSILKYTIEPVGDSMKEVSDFCWSSKNESTYYLGIAIDGRVNICAYSSQSLDAKLRLVALKSIEISASVPSPTLFLFFKYSEYLRVHSQSGNIATIIDGDEFEGDPVKFSSFSSHLWELKFFGFFPQI